jgi:hypothetical protein
MVISAFKPSRQYVPEKSLTFFCSPAMKTTVSKRNVMTKVNIFFILTLLRFISGGFSYRRNNMHQRPEKPRTH